MRRPDSGIKGIALLVKHDPALHAEARAALTRLLLEHAGNKARAAVAIGLASAQALRGVADALGMREWWDGGARPGPEEKR